MVCGLQFCEGERGCHFGVLYIVLANLRISFQILSATLKVDTINPILQMRKLRLRTAKKLAQSHTRTLQNQNL